MNNQLNIYSKNLSDLEQYMSEIKNLPHLSKEEEIELAKKKDKGDLMARNILVKCNLRFVAKRALNYDNSKICILDLIQEGNIGLIKGVEKFDYKKGFRLLTYANSYINKYFLDYFKSNYTILNIPKQIYRDSKIFRKIYESLSKEFEHVSIKEVASKMKISIDYATELYYLQKSPLSLDAPIEEFEDINFEDFLKSNSLTPEEEYLLLERSLMIQKLFDKYISYYQNRLDDSIESENLKKIENAKANLKRAKIKIQIIKDRYELNDSHTIKTYNEIASELGYTHQGIQSLERKALEELKTFTKSLKL